MAATPSAIFCYAPADADLARRIGEYLELNVALACCYEEALVRPDFDLVDAVGRGLSADRAIVLLSPESVPQRWERDRWPPVFQEQPRELGSQLYVLLIRPCKFPELLRRHNFCDLSQDFTAGLRQLKRLMFHANRAFQAAVSLPALVPGWRPPDPQLRTLLADRPGTASEIDREQALVFAHTARDEFEGVFWIDCAGRSRAGMLGDIGHAAGLSLTGSTEQNRETMRDFYERRRCLLVLDHVRPEDREFVNLGGRASFLFTGASAIPASPQLGEVVHRFSVWSRDPEGALCWLTHAHAWLRERPTMSDLGMAMLALLKHYERLAEANEILEILMEGARRQSDHEALHRLRWEQSWILGHWGEPYVAAAMPMQSPRDTTQLAFDFLKRRSSG